MERKWFFRLAGGAALMAAAYLGIRSLQNRASTENLIAPKNTNALATPTLQNLAEITAIPTEQNRGTTKVNGMTGAVYQVVPDPSGKGRECLKVGPYSEANKDTVDGAAVALRNPNIYIDVA